MDDVYYMKKALDLAEKGLGFTSPNPMVGSVVVKDGSILGKGYHQAVGQAHGEVNALNNAGDATKDATLYITLEPCNHTGRTPPCTEKILASGVRRVVVAMLDPNPDVTGGGLAYLQQRGIEVTLGVCEKQARTLNEAYIKYVQTKRPFVIMKCAATLDGRIASRTGDSKWISGTKSRRYVHRLRHGADGILVGSGTVVKDNPSLTTRLENVDGRDPTRIILDETLTISEEAKVLRLKSDSDTILITGKAASAEKKKRIEKEGVRVISADLKNQWIDLDMLMDLLGKMGMTSLLIEGGSHVFTSALSSGIVDKIIFFYGPKILGGDEGFPIFRGPGPALMADSIPVRDIRVRRFDDDVMIEGYLGSS